MKLFRRNCGCRKCFTDESGSALLPVLALILVITLWGTVSFLSVNKDIVHTQTDFENMKRSYLADAGLAWALAISKIPPIFADSTHNSDETKTDPEKIKYLTEDPKYRFRSEDSLIFDAEGWLTSVTSGKGNTLTGSEEETIKIKIWFPAPLEMRIISTAIVNGKANTVNLIGDIK